MSGDFVDIPSEAVNLSPPVSPVGLLRSGVASVKINSVPTPSVLMTLIFWLCARMISRTMDKPSPMPFLSLPRETVGLVKTAPRSLGGSVRLEMPIAEVSDGDEDDCFFRSWTLTRMSLACRTEFYRIVQQVVNDLLDAFFVRPDDHVGSSGESQYQMQISFSRHWYFQWIGSVWTGSPRQMSNSVRSR